MIRFFCDRCGNEINVPNPYSVYLAREIGASSEYEMDVCESCSEALKRFLGINSAGYEQLESERGGDQK